MKQAFTMIELIFVIVILGILAAVAIPRLAATRDDAEIVKAAQNITTSLTDLMGYYTAKGAYAQEFKQMTSVANPIKVKDNVCATYSFVTDKQILLKRGYDGLCTSVWNFNDLKDLSTIYSSDALIIVE